jgi:hypothetical protein
MTGAEREDDRVAGGAPPVSSAPASPANQRDLVESLHELALLRDVGVLTEDEYQRAKEKVVESRRLTGDRP